MIPEVSIIIVHYRAKKELFDCLSAIDRSKPTTTYELIVVDNDVDERVEKYLEKVAPWVRYVRSVRNVGFGAGNNLGAKKARGKYLFFLNPDTIVGKETIDQCVYAMIKRKIVGIVAPQLLDRKRQVYPFQCTDTLTPLTGLVAHSVINRFFPKNTISERYWLSEWDRKSQREVEVIHGAAFMVEKALFEKLGGFDEQFFMYFEESDFCLRVRQAGRSILFEPKAKVIHLSGKSTADKKKALEIYRRSRTYYFTKHFGLVEGKLCEVLFWTLDRWKGVSFILAVVVLAGIRYAKRGK